jgi:hypothetical protein
MRKVLLNGIELDIDEETIIGFDIQTYDVKEPAKPKVIISNNVSFPPTSTNLKAIGFTNNPQVDSEVAFNLMLLTYIEGNDIIVENAKVRITEVLDRIKLVIYQKNDAWDTFKLLKFPDIEAKLFAFLAVKYNYPTVLNKAGSFATFLDFFINSNHGIIIPFYFSNLYNQETESGSGIYLEGLDFITLANGGMQGGHFSVYAKDFFQFLEDEYNIDFQTNELFDGNIFQDLFATKVFIPFQSLTIINNGGYYLNLNETETYTPLKDVTIKADKSIYDFVIAFFQHFNVIIDNFWLNGSYVNRCYRFDDMLNYAPIKNWSGKLSGQSKYIPIVDGYAQKNYITFSKIYEGGDKYFNSRKILCANKNIDPEIELFSINAYVPNGVTSDAGKWIPDLSVSNAFTDFTFLIDSGQTQTVKVWFNTENIDVTLKVPALYDLSSEYQLLESVMNKPRLYEAEKWLTLSDIRNIRFFCQYYIEELGGCFFLNKIKGYVAGSLKSSTKIELIKISNNTLLNIPDADNYIDGVGNDFTDGNNNLLF